MLLTLGALLVVWLCFWASDRPPFGFLEGAIKDSSAYTASDRMTSSYFLRRPIAEVLSGARAELAGSPWTSFVNLRNFPGREGETWQSSLVHPDGGVIGSIEISSHDSGTWVLVELPPNPLQKWVHRFLNGP